MDCCASSYYRIPNAETLPTVVKIQGRRRDLKILNKFGFGFSQTKRSILPFFQEFGGNIEQHTNRTRRVFAAAVVNKKNTIIIPLEPRTSAGNFLNGMLHNQRHLFNFAVAEQLHQLASDRDGLFQSNHSVLHRRIAEMKELECQTAVEDVMYMSIVHKFSEIEVQMVPRLSGCISNNKLEISPSKYKELESVHTFEVQELIWEHLATVIRWKGGNITSKTTTTQIHRLQLGQIYAASIMYGYFLKSASLRYHLESRVGQIQGDFPLDNGIYVPLTEVQTHGFKCHSVFGQSRNAQATSLCEGSPRCGRKLGKLKNYLMGFDTETLQGCAKLKSKEAVNLIEKHTWAVFGDERIGDLNADNMITVTIPSLERLVLEAVAFGSFLWDVERYVDSVYRLKEN